MFRTSRDGIASRTDFPFNAQFINGCIIGPRRRRFLLRSVYARERTMRYDERVKLD